MRPGVQINISNGNLGRVATTTDGVAGLIVTGVAVEGKLELNKSYLFGGSKDLEKYGITKETNPLLYKDVKTFYAQAGDGAELHVLVVADATTLTSMCDPIDSSPLRKLIDSANGRIRIVAVNKLAPVAYELDTTQGIDGDAITAAEKAQATAEYCASVMKPFRLLLAAPKLDLTVEQLFQPCGSSYNRVGIVVASDDEVNHTAAMGLVLARAAKIQPQQSLGRVKDGSIATKLYLTNGGLFEDKYANILFDAGYIAPINYPTKNGAYLNGDAMAAPVTDDYSQLSLGRIIDKATVITYNTYISEVLDNIQIEESGTLSAGACVSFARMLENAIAVAMGTQISNVIVFIDPAQNILSSGMLEIECQITPLATMRVIKVNLGFMNPALKND